MFMNGASYSNDFSAVFRTAKGAELCEPIKDEDLNGTDPLPKYAAAAWVTIAGYTHAAGAGTVRYKRVTPLDAPLDVSPRNAQRSSGTSATGQSQSSGTTMQRSSTRATR